MELNLPVKQTLKKFVSKINKQNQKEPKFLILNWTLHRKGLYYMDLWFFKGTLVSRVPFLSS